MGCPACGPATGAEWARKRHRAAVAEEARRLREALSRGWFTRSAWRAGLVWAAHVLFELPEAAAGPGGGPPPAS